MGDVLGACSASFSPVTLAVTIRHFGRGLAYAHPMMSARILRHSKRAAGTHLSTSERAFGGDDRVLRPDAEVCPSIPDDHAVVAVSNPAAYGFPLHHHSQRIFSRCRTPDVIQGTIEAPPTISSKAWQPGNWSLQRQFWPDPAVESLSSFIGAMERNTTTKRGRISINLKPLNPAQHQRVKA